MDLTKEEYDNWLETADKVEQEHCVFSSMCGPHEFANIIHKNGIAYELCWGWDVINNKETNYFYSVKQLFALDGQYGDKI